MSVTIPTIDFSDLFKGLFAEVRVVYSYYSNKLGDMAMDAKDVLAWSKGTKRVSLIQFNDYKFEMGSALETLVEALLSDDRDFPPRISKAIEKLQEWEMILDM